MIPALKDRVSFSVYDLLDESSSCPPASIYGEFDLTVCSNLLFYYRPELRQWVDILKVLYNRPIVWIIGKALYAGQVDLSLALEVARS